MNPLIAFYSGTEPDHAGRYISQIQAWNDAQLESVHDYIQWLFPLPEPSPVNPLAPVLEQETIEIFRKTAQLRTILHNSLARMLRFYGFEQTAADRVIEAANFKTRARNWLNPGNHNHLRITRIIRSTRLLGLESESAAFFEALRALYATQQGSSNISRTTYSYWLSAYQPEAALSLRMEHNPR
jgi:Opioid growth factor receptor (OGFr) conserved region